MNTLNKIQELEDLIKENQFNLTLKKEFSYYEELINSIVGDLEEKDNKIYELEEELQIAERINAELREDTMPYRCRRKVY